MKQRHAVVEFLWAVIKEWKVAVTSSLPLLFLGVFQIWTKREIGIGWYLLFLVLPLFAAFYTAWNKERVAKEGLEAEIAALPNVDVELSNSSRAVSLAVTNNGAGAEFRALMDIDGTRGRYAMWESGHSGRMYIGRGQTAHLVLGNFIVQTEAYRTLTHWKINWCNDDIASQTDTRVTVVGDDNFIPSIVTVKLQLVSKPDMITGARRFTVKLNPTHAELIDEAKIKRENSDVQS